MQKPWDLIERTTQFAVAVFTVCRTLPKDDEARDIARQLRRSASAVPANYRSAKRGKSGKDFANKIGVVIEEADESAFWLDFLVRVELTQRPAVKDLCEEANELVAIFTATQKTARKKQRSGECEDQTARPHFTFRI